MEIRLHVSGDGRRGWQRALDMAGVSYEVSGGPPAAAREWFGAVYTGDTPPVAVMQVAELGGLVIHEPSPPHPLSVEELRLQVELADASHDGCLFSAAPASVGSARHEAVWGKVRQVEESSWNPMVVFRRVGRGYVARLATNVTSAYSDAAPVSRYTDCGCFSPVECNRNDKWLLDLLVYGLLFQSYSLLGVPFIHKWFFPGRSRGLSMLRIDVDNVQPDLSDLKRITTITRHFGVRATYYVNTRNNEDRLAPMLQLLETTPGARTGSHGHEHVVPESEAEATQNLRDAEERLAGSDIFGRDYAGPCGACSSGLLRALSACGYRSCSEFQFDWDSYPSLVADGVVTLPVHPVCPGLALDFDRWSHTIFFRANYLLYRFGRKVFGTSVPVLRRSFLRMPVKDVVGYYQQAVARLRERSLPVHLYGHPHDLGQRGLGLVLEALCSLVAPTPDFPNLVAEEFASFVQYRNQTELHYDYDLASGTGIVSLRGNNNHAWNLAVNRCDDSAAALRCTVDCLQVRPFRKSWHKDDA